MEKIEKVWGFEEIWVNNESYCFKILVLKPGFTSSRHYHQKKKETFLVLKGYCCLELKDQSGLTVYKMEPEKQITIEPGTSHRFYLPKEADRICIIYEISTHHDDSDVVRQSESHKL